MYLSALIVAMTLSGPAHDGWSRDLSAAPAAQQTYTLAMANAADAAKPAKKHSKKKKKA
jgi:hypothetical protein